MLNRNVNKSRKLQLRPFITTWYRECKRSV